MKAETHMDYLMQRHDRFNALVDMRQDGEDATTRTKKKSGGKKDGTGGFFGAAVGEMFFRHPDGRRPRIVGITHPSDGHPQEELTPDFGWFRALSYNNPTWTLYWPELII